MTAGPFRPGLFRVGIKGIPGEVGLFLRQQMDDPWLRPDSFLRGCFCRWQKTGPETSLRSGRRGALS